MKFWATTIVSIIVLSAAVTWLTMQGGAGMADQSPQTEAARKYSPATPEEAPQESRLVFELGENQSRTANTIVVDYGDSGINQTHTTEIKFRNEGDGPLVFRFRRGSCKCLERPKLNGKELGGQESEPVGPGAEGVLTLSWKPTYEELPLGAPPKPHRFTTWLLSNDESLADLILEIDTRLAHQDG